MGKGPEGEAELWALTLPCHACFYDCKPGGVEEYSNGKGNHMQHNASNENSGSDTKQCELHTIGKQSFQCTR